MANKLEFDLSALERIFKDSRHSVSHCLDGPVLEITESPNFQAALLANQHRFVCGSTVIPGNDGITPRASGADLDFVCHDDRS